MATSSVVDQGRQAAVVQPGLGVRGRLMPLRARLMAPRIDRQLAAGIPSWESPVYVVRARQLTSEHTRRGLADAIDRVLEVADYRRPKTLMTAAITPQRSAVQQARPTLLLLSARLRSPAPISARGVALLRALLTDGAGPLYKPSPPTALADKVRAIDELLDASD